MPILQQPIQRKLSALLGAEVTFEKLSFSLLGGSIEASGVKISARADLPPVLTIARVRAQVAVPRALKGEIAITSLTIEKPVLTLVRQSDGTTNFPRRIKPGPGSPPALSPQPIDESQDKNRWKFDAAKVLLIDGAGALIDDSLPGGRYEWSAGPILAELNRTPGGYSTTLIADNVQQPKAGHSIGTIRLNGTFDNAADLTVLPQAKLDLMIEIAKLFKARITSPALASKVIEMKGDGAINAKQLLALLPSGAVSPALRSLSGQLQIDLAARTQPGTGIIISELNLRAVGLSVKLPL